MRKTRKQIETAANAHLGRKIGRLTIERFSHSDKRWRKWFECSCECGGGKTVMLSAMESGNTKSCGCLVKEARMKRRDEAIRTNQGPKTAILLQYKRHARGRRLEFAMDGGAFIEITQQNCHYCGEPPSNSKKTKTHTRGYLYNGVDRVDNSRGYIPGNCVACCRICNYAKSDMCAAAFRGWVRRAYAHMFPRDAMAEQWGGL